MLTAHKRSNPYEDEDVRMEVCSGQKRGRWDEAPLKETPLRKRSLNQGNMIEPTYTLKDLERARDEGRLQSNQKVRSLISANEALRHALQEAVFERDKLASDCKVLKAGVLSLNTRSTQLTRELDITSTQLREESERTRALQSAIIAMHANWSLGGCRKDDHAGAGPDIDGDVF